MQEIDSIQMCLVNFENINKKTNNKSDISCQWLLKYKQSF